jgi:cysteine-rich repeat protein
MADRNSVKGAAAVILVLAALLAPGEGGEVRAAEGKPDAQAAGSRCLKTHRLAAKLGTDLAVRALETGVRTSGQTHSPRRPVPARQATPVGDTVLVEAAAEGDPLRLLRDLRALGLTDGQVAGRLVSGFLPVTSLEPAAALPTLRFARSSRFRSWTGSVTGQGDMALRADLARAATGADGTGVTVGILADSFDCAGTGLADDVASDDLPSATTVLQEGTCPAGIDEGRAMAQVVHDVAPGAAILFRSAARGQADLAAGIQDLAAAGVDVIVDDVLYETEPMFQDGPVAQAVDAAAALGIPFISAAGNLGRRAYEAPFRGSGLSVIYGGDAHDFDPGPGVDIYQAVTLPVDQEIAVTLQWDSPFFSVSGAPGSSNDLDFCLMNEPPTVLIACGENLNVGRDPVEVLSFFNDGAFGTEFNLVIELFEGPAPDLLKYVLLASGTATEYDTGSGALFGHAQAAGALGVGAAFYHATPEFGASPAALQPTSSVGGTPILFDASGNRLPAPEQRDSPWIVGPDGVNTTFFGADIPDPGGGSDRDRDPNFFGTSAAAAHVAGVAALLRHRNGAMTPADVAAALSSAAGDMDDPATAGFDTGFDFATGYGFCVADAALAAVPECGDGMVEAPEECDDANTVDDDACGNDCLANICGDGVVHVNNGEECDDGNGVEDDFCRNDCRTNSCGDGRLTNTSAELLANGNFEAGTLAAWEAASLGDGAFVVATPGTPTPIGGFATASNPTGGAAFALSDQVGEGVRALEQSFTVPATANEVSVAFEMFVNDQSGLGPIIDPVGLDHTGPPNQHARADILISGAPPFATEAAVVQNLYLGVDPGSLPNPYVSYLFDLTSVLAPGQTYELRFAEVDNQHFLHQGVDNVSVTASLVEDCDDGNNVDGDGCSAACVTESCLPPDAVRGVAFLADSVTMQWNAGGVELFDVARSDVPPGSGVAGTEACLAQATAAASVDDPSAPGPGAVLYYLVRGRNGCGPGTYGLASTGGERISGACP